MGNYDPSWELDRLEDRDPALDDTQEAPILDEFDPANQIDYRAAYEDLRHAYDELFAENRRLIARIELNDVVLDEIRRLYAQTYGVTRIPSPLECVRNLVGSLAYLEKQVKE